MGDIMATASAAVLLSFGRKNFMAAPRGQKKCFQRQF
jgi:hypothetical protein